MKYIYDRMLLRMNLFLQNSINMTRTLSRKAAHKIKPAVNNSSSNQNGDQNKTEVSNEDLANIFTEMAEYEKNINANVFKYNAYIRAATSLMNCPIQIKSGAQAMSLDGIGKRIALRIDQYLKTRRMYELEKLKTNENYKAIYELVRVFGIGPAHARKFVKEGIKTIDDLRNHEDKLTHEAKMGLKYLEDLEQHIPREEMKRIDEFVEKEVKALDGMFLVNMCGSYRRGLATSKDIDIMLTHPRFVSESFAKAHKNMPHPEFIVQGTDSPRGLIQRVIDRLFEVTFLVDEISFGDTKFMGMCSLSGGSPFRKIDIRIFPSDEYYTALLYFTGNSFFVHEMRKLANKQGYFLNEYSLRKVDDSGVAGKPLKIESEKDIFDTLGIVYKPPEERNTSMNLLHLQELD